MSAVTANLSRDTLHRELLVRLAGVREYVEGKIPSRLHTLISADDILQEVWVAAYGGLSTFVPQGPNAMEWWLKTIAKSRIANAIEAARRVKRGGRLRQVNNANRPFTSFVNLFA